MREPFKIIICGEGGQGVLSIAKIVALAAWLQGRKSVYLPYFSTEKRGGLSMAYAQIGDEPIRFAKFDQADLGVALSQRAVARLAGHLKDDASVIVNSFLVKDVSALAKWKTSAIDAATIAREKLKKPRTFNMVIMGAMLRSIPGLTEEGFEKALDKVFADKYVKDPSLRELNAKALETGYALTA